MAREDDLFTPLIKPSSTMDEHYAVETTYNAKLYAEVKPKIVLETTSAIGAKFLLFVTYATFFAAVAIDLHSTLASASPVELSSAVCQDGTVLNSTVIGACTTPLSNQSSFWEAYIVNLENLVGTIRLQAKFPNGTDCSTCSSDAPIIQYDISVYGCYEASSCSSHDFQKVLQAKQETAVLSTSILSTDRYFELFSVFQNQESLPGFGRVRSYHMRVNFSENAGLLDGDWASNYYFQYHASASNIAQASFRVILLFAVLTMGYFWFYYLYTDNPNPWKWLKERKWLTFFLLGVCIYVNPVYCTAIFMQSPNVSLIFSSELMDVIGMTVLFTVWLMFADGYRRAHLSRLRFYGPKLAFAAFMLLTSIALTVLNYPTLYSDRSALLAVQNWPTSLQDGYLSACVIFIFLVLVWTFWYAFSLVFTGNSLRKEPYMKTRYQQLSFRFFVLQASLVGVAYILQYMTILGQILGNSADYGTTVQTTADNFNQLLRTTTQAFGKSMFITVYLCIILYLHLPPSAVSDSPFNTTYVLMEKEHRSIVRRRKREKFKLRALGRIIDAKAEVFCVETAQWLLEVADQAYCDTAEEPCLGESSVGIINLDQVDYTLLDRIYDPATETYCILCRHKTLPRVVVAFRGTCTEVHWKTNLQFQQQEVDLGKNQLDTVDSEDGLDEVAGVDGGEIELQADDNPFDYSSDESEDVANATVSRNVIQESANRIGRGVNQGVDMIGEGVGFIGRTIVTAADVTRVNRIPVLKQALKIFLHKGFWASYSSIREQLHRILRKELMKDPAHLYVTGHSLGGALATLAAADLTLHTLPRLNGYLKQAAGESRGSAMSLADDPNCSTKKAHRINLTMYNFGSPRVGNHQFASQFNKLVPDAFRVVVDGDIVTGVPSTWYKHVGTEILIDGLNRCGTIIVDPSFVEKRLNTKRKTQVQVHSTKCYRQGLQDVASAANQIIEDTRKRDSNVTIDLEKGKARAATHMEEDLDEDVEQQRESSQKESSSTATIPISRLKTVDESKEHHQDLATSAAEQMGARNGLLERSWQSVKHLSFAFRGNTYFSDPDTQPKSQPPRY